MFGHLHLRQSGVKETHVEQYSEVMFNQLTLVLKSCNWTFLIASSVKNFTTFRLVKKRRPFSGQKNDLIRPTYLQKNSN